MAESLTGRFVRPSAPAAVDEGLSALWAEAGRAAPVARALMANLVVIRERPANESVDLAAPLDDVPIEEVACRHPSRIIVLHHGEKPDLCAPVAATIGIMLFGPPHARFGVEEITIRSACAEPSLPSIVRRLTFGDLPSSIWWTGDLSNASLLSTLAAIGRQIVYDSRRWRDVRRGVLALVPLLKRAHPPDLADVNWRRLTPLRLAIVQGLASFNGHLDPRTVTIRIHHRPGEDALAWLLAGWFASRLSWPAGTMPAPIAAAGDGNEILSVAIEPPAHQESAGDRDARASTPAPVLTAAIDDHYALVRFGSPVAPLSIAIRSESYADAVAAELRSLTHEICLRDVLVALGKRFSGTTETGG